MSGELLIRGVRPWPSAAELPAVDVLCSAGRIDQIGVGLAAPAEAPVVDGGGGVLLPSFVDAHGRLDALRPGITMVRAHVPVDELDEALARRDELLGRVEVQLVALAPAGAITGMDALDAALTAGADLVGGVDPARVDRDPVRHLDVVFGLADKHRCGVDIQLDDPGELGAFELELICERTAALDMRGQVSVVHATALSTVDPDRQDELIDRLAEADVAVVATRPLPLRKLRWGGVRVGIGGIDVWQLAEAEGYTADPMIEMCADTATRGGAAVLGERDHGLVEGDRAEFVVLPGDTVAQVIRQGLAPTLVVHQGRVV
ncbi:N-isopropylammelide isopropylaminohydrolase [Kutzneria sp. NPDC052558]|uniref:N-isopropylammelide isopropylaminohydrolase n=1 Tax=Kutzneria sp. NPDC052558 TaxID=3364121 RepID=UPI0037C82981